MSLIYPLYNSFLPNGMMFPSALSTELGAFASPFDSGNQNPYLKVLGNPMNPFLNRMSYNDEVLSVFTILVLIFYMLTPTVWTALCGNLQAHHYVTRPLTNASQLNLYPIHLFWRHHPMKIFFLMCGNRYMSFLRRITNASCVLTSPPDENFLLNLRALCSTVYVSIVTIPPAHKCIPIESLPNSFVLTSPPN